MPAFRFRAQAALDLRRREHDEARRALAAAEAARRDAQRALEETMAMLARASAEAASAMAKPGTRGAIEWHRSWMVRLQYERAARADTLRARDAEAAGAAAACARAKQRVESLERLREKARDAWAREALAREQKETDAVAAVRFVTGNRS